MKNRLKYAIVMVLWLGGGMGVIACFFALLLGRDLRQVFIGEGNLLIEILLVLFMLFLVALFLAPTGNESQNSGYKESSRK